LTGLRKLSVHRKKISDAGLIHLRNLTELEWLSLSYNSLSDAALIHLRELKKLRYLFLGNTTIRGPGLKHLHALPVLEALHLDQTPTAQDERILAEIISDLIRQGILVLGPTVSYAQQNFYTVSFYGEDCIRNNEIIPHDPDGYLALAKAKVPWWIQ
jgi:hypothetical protein